MMSYLYYGWIVFCIASVFNGTIHMMPVHRMYDRNSGLYCEITGPCEPCPVSPQNRDGCEETNYRQEIKCPLLESNGLVLKKENKEVIWQTQWYRCEVIIDHSYQHFIYLQLVMILVFGISYGLLRGHLQIHNQLPTRLKNQD